jgi:hypothetical protein
MILPCEERECKSAAPVRLYTERHPQKRHTDLRTLAYLEPSLRDRGRTRPNVINTGRSADVEDIRCAAGRSPDRSARRLALRRHVSQRT